MTLAHAMAQHIFMQDQVSPRRGKKLFVLAVIGLAGLAAAWWLFRHYGTDARMIVDAGVGKVRQLGAGRFFMLMALLPAVGCPLSVFTLTAGPVFAPTIGMPMVLGLVWVSVAVNLAISYWLSRYALRPWLARLIGWLGYKLPEVKASDHRGLVILVRVTPGPPYVLQSYLLGLANIPFGTYFYISWVISSLYSCAFVLFGDALIQGKGKMALVAVGLFAALTVGVQLLRRHYRRRKEKAQA
ncbi:MAG: TVP38/TMEM64 family protein [Opitutaceae bacterium]|nr:TVP38/TMEM64 family protein [Opitutaceae bacterium]